MIPFGIWYESELLHFCLCSGLAETLVPPGPACQTPVHPLRLSSNYCPLTLFVVPTDVCVHVVDAPLPLVT